MTTDITRHPPLSWADPVTARVPPISDRIDRWTWRVFGLAVLVSLVVIVAAQVRR